MGRDTIFAFLGIGIIIFLCIECETSQKEFVKSQKTHDSIVRLYPTHHCDCFKD